MDLKLIKSQFFHESMARRVFFRVFLFASAMSIIPIVHILATHPFTNFPLPKPHGCYTAARAGDPQLPRGSYLFQGHFLNPVWSSLDSPHCHQNVNLTITLVKQLADRDHLFNHSAKVLYVGGSSSSAVAALRDLGFARAAGVEFGFKLDYEPCWFDFVLFRGRLKVSVADFVVREVERVLGAGGIGAVVSGGRKNSTRIAGVLESSRVLRSGYVNDLYVTVFKKESGNGGFSDQRHRRPVECSAVVVNRTLLQTTEHL